MGGKNYEHDVQQTLGKSVGIASWVISACNLLTVCAFGDDVDDDMRDDIPLGTPGSGKKRRNRGRNNSGAGLNETGNNCDNEIRRSHDLSDVYKDGSMSQQGGQQNSNHVNSYNGYGGGFFGGGGGGAGNSDRRGGSRRGCPAQEPIGNSGGAQGGDEEFGIDLDKEFGTNYGGQGRGGGGGGSGGAGGAGGQGVYDYNGSGQQYNQAAYGYSDDDPANNPFGDEIVIPDDSADVAAGGRPASTRPVSSYSNRV